MTDVLVIGSGAGGGALAYSLARAGHRVTVLEKGPRYRRAEYDHDTGVMPDELIPSVSSDPHTVVTPTTQFPLPTRLGWNANCVGGGTEHMGAYMARFHPDDFRMHSRYGDYAELADWPYGYDDLEPYYGLAEHALGVSGEAGTNPFEGPRSGDYPMPPMAAHPIAARLDEVCSARGTTPFPIPRAINSRPYNGRPACAYCNVCASYGCPVGARGTSQEALIAAAEATGNCEVRTRATVQRIDTDRSGRARGCTYIGDDGAEHEVRADVVCVCCSAVESARLLLLSASSRFPEGVANASGRVGRHLQFHAVTMGSAFIPAEHVPDDAGPSRSTVGRSTVGRSTVGRSTVGRAVMDYYFLPEGVSDIAKGGLLRFGRSPQLPPMREPKDTAGGLRVYFEVFHDFIPNAETYLELDDKVRDRWDRPVARIHLAPPEHHRRAGRWVMDRAFEILGDLGGQDYVANDVGGTSRYLLHGTCRAGSDPAVSVLDPFCRSPDVPNLFVVDGSFMPTSAGAPPTLTIVANAFRVAEHIVSNF